MSSAQLNLQYTDGMSYYDLNQQVNGQTVLYANKEFKIFNEHNEATQICLAAAFSAVVICSAILGITLMGPFKLTGLQIGCGIVGGGALMAGISSASFIQHKKHKTMKERKVTPQEFNNIKRTLEQRIAEDARDEENRGKNPPRFTIFLFICGGLEFTC